jgi:hypothetical protein
VDAIDRKDFAWIANHMIYPLSVDSSHRTQPLNSKEEFRIILSRDLTDTIRAKILDAAKKPLFKNWQGVMIGDGILWFTEYANDANDANGPWTYGIAAIGDFAFQSESVSSPPGEGANAAGANVPSP